ncbi:fasciclin domain-containing protein [Mucilaginibacter sp. SP1R1]|uniref:fasciclin domain-containing protein n=1 Tax=Mucilaginibacter sp. SP1R1 TaxID=2723091 RepID=UPI00161939FA|nr:fasciclin domain-containing protein [Mucilaginibacter sp. SP1R1]MBB6148484.1 putative surface protein with fasciclin (FAS1) repeats [Mucilaginibacter sp. SP1R1]
MKNILLLALTLFCGAAVFGQTTDTTTNKAPTIGTLKTNAGDGMLPANDIVQNIEQSKDFSVLYNFIKSSSLIETYQSKGPITIFAPDNRAFENLPVGKLDSLSRPAHVWELTGILTYHAVAGKLSAKDIEKQINGHKGLVTFTTLGGGKLNAKIDSNRNIVLVDETGGESVINRFDIVQSNGMLHVVNKVLIPKAKAL